MKKSVAEYASELLFYHDCVIISGFGGFICNYSPATIHPFTHTFSPPSRKILFNPGLKTDDGLLASHIAFTEKTGYHEALIAVEEFGRLQSHLLDRGEKVSLGKIGSLEREKTGTFRFVQDTELNYLDEAFGLPVFISPPVRVTRGRYAHDRLMTGRSLIPANQGNMKKVMRSAAFLLPAVVISAWLIFQPARIPRYLVVKSSVAPPVEMVRQADEKGTAGEESAQAGNDQHGREMIIPADPEQKILSVAPSTSTNAKYLIIGGAFRVGENARKLVESLKQQGFEASIAGLSSSGLTMVSYGTFNDKEKALSQLNYIKQFYNPSAWMLSR